MNAWHLFGNRENYRITDAVWTDLSRSRVVATVESTVQTEEGPDVEIFSCVMDGRADGIGKTLWEIFAEDKSIAVHGEHDRILLGELPVPPGMRREAVGPGEHVLVDEESERLAALGTIRAEQDKLLAPRQIVRAEFDPDFARHRRTQLEILWEMEKAIEENPAVAKKHNFRRLSVYGREEAVLVEGLSPREAVAAVTRGMK